MVPGGDMFTISYLSLVRWGEAEMEQIDTEVSRHDRSGFQESWKPSVRLAWGTGADARTTFGC